MLNFLFQIGDFRQSPVTNLTLDHLREDSTAFLILDVDAEDFDGWLRQNYQIIFEEQLWGWWTDATHWPVKRGLRVFRAWFDVAVHLGLRRWPCRGDRRRLRR